jgi:hypothetical protein
MRVLILSAFIFSLWGTAANAIWPFADKLDAPAPAKIDAQPAPANPPMSRIFATVSASLERLKQELEKAAPQSQSGARGDPVGNPVIDDVLEWNASRSPITISGGDNAISASTTIGGTVRIRGTVRLIRGDIGKLLGKLNPTNIPFSAHADLGANASITARPGLLPNWRLSPNLSLAVDLFKAEVPINNVGTISVRGLVRDDLAGKVAGLQNDLNNRIANDPFLEQEARKLQEQVCKVHEFDAGDGRKGWVVAFPEAWEATQPKIDVAYLMVGLGLRAKTQVFFGERPADPSCPDLAPLELQETIPAAAFNLSVPADLPWSELSKAAAAGLKGKGFTREGFGETITAMVTDFELAPNGDRLQAKVAFDGKIEGWFGEKFSGTVYLFAKPSLDRENRQLRFTDVDMTIESEKLLSVAGVFGKLLVPLLEEEVAELAVVDLQAQADKAKMEADKALTKLNSDLTAQGLQLDGSLDDVELQDVAIGEKTLSVLIGAKGKVVVQFQAMQ